MKVIKASYKIETPIDRVKIYTNLELYGRNAYKSEEKITTDSAVTFIENILKTSMLTVQAALNTQSHFKDRK